MLMPGRHDITAPSECLPREPPHLEPEPEPEPKQQEPGTGPAIGLRPGRGPQIGQGLGPSLLGTMLQQELELKTEQQPRAWSGLEPVKNSEL